MKSNIIYNRWLWIYLFLNFTVIINAENPIKVSASFHYFLDLSDTFKGGSLLNAEVGVKKNWYGLRASYGYFQSQSSFIHQITADVPNNFVIDVPIEEISIMKTIAISSFFRPVQSKWISADMQLGICYNNSKRLVFKDIYYSYDIKEHRFTSLVKDYILSKGRYMGYQIGINLSFCFSEKISFDISSRIQSLHKGGSFFFVGGGLSFNL